MKIRFFFALYDFWTGIFVDSKKSKVYLCPLPCFVTEVSRCDHLVIEGNGWVPITYAAAAALLLRFWWRFLR